MKNKTVLLNPGPVNISDRVRKALLKNDICHREEEFTSLMQGIRRKILSVYNIDDKIYASVLITGSGTAGVEAAVASLFSDDETLLVISNGVYGERIAKIASAYGKKIREVLYKWGTEINLNEIEDILKADNTIGAVAVVHHETTTGILNRISEIGKLAKRYNKVVMIDAVSSYAGEELKLDEWGIDIACGTANKCIHGVPGVSFVVARRELFHKMKDKPKKTVYLDLINYYFNEEDGIPPFTPAIQVMYAFDEALDELLEQGVQGRIDWYKKLSGYIRAEAKKAGLKTYLPEEVYSNTLTSFYLPKGVTYEELHGLMKREGFVIYAGVLGLYKDIFRVSNMGEITFEEMDRFFKIIESIRSPLTPALSREGRG